MSFETMELGFPFENLITKCRPFCRFHKKRDKTTYLIVHRADPLEIARNLSVAKGKQMYFEDSAVGLAKAHWMHIRSTQEMPYAFFIKRDGLCQQSRSADRYSPHALGAFGRNGVGIAVQGNFNREAPTQSQLNTLSRLLAILKMHYGIEIRDIGGHNMFDGASTRKPNDCPGPLLDMTQVKAEVADLEAGVIHRRVTLSGIDFS